MKRVYGMALAALLFAPAALAQGGDEARTYFEIGAKAYQKGNYLDAVKAFEEAYRRSSRPGLLFSLGQAHRMEYFARNDVARLKDAVHYYQEYLAREPSGKRAAEATDALSKLKPLLPAEEDKPAATKPVAPAKPRVMISSPTPDVKVSFDGKAVTHPFIAEVEPGRHKVTLSAPGFEDYTREIVVDAKAGAPPLDVPLKELPAVLAVQTEDGAEISIDGRLQGIAPLPPLKLGSGKHFVAVTSNGRQAFSKFVKLERGERKSLDASLESTGQRKASWIMLGVGAGGLVAGGVLGYVALKKQSDADQIKSRSEASGNLSPSDVSRYDSLRSSRDSFRMAAVISAGAGAGVGAIGLMLRLFDQPRVPLPPAEEAVPGEPKPTTPAAPSSMEVSVAPFYWPGVAGASLGGRF